MSLEVGKYTAVIEENDLRSAGTGTEFVYLRVNIAGETMPVQIYLTEKGANYARAQLKACAFDVDHESVSVLLEKPQYLSGRQVPVEVYEEEYKGRLRLKCRITTSSVSKKRVGALDAMLRGAEATVSAEPEDDLPF